MPTHIRVWEVQDKMLKPVEGASFSKDYHESDLETWIENDPDLLGEPMLIIDRQRLVKEVSGKFDLLGIDDEGQLIIIELKRDRTSREAIAQALDYASWLDSQTGQKIKEFSREYLNQPLADKFSEKFNDELPEIDCRNHRILLVAARLDASAERIMTYLSERHKIDIRAVFFEYYKLSDGKKILARSTLVLEETGATSSGKIVPSWESLLALAAQHQTQPLLEICRQTPPEWHEYPSKVYGGSFRYLAGDVKVFGINVAAKNGPPQGELDVWVQVEPLSEATGADLAKIQQRLKDEHPVEKVQTIKASEKWWLRLKTPAEAEKLMDQLRNWTSPQAGVART